MVSSQSDMKIKVSPQTFEFSKTGMIGKNDIEESNSYVLCILSKDELDAFEINIEVWYDSPVGNGLVPLHDKQNMILLSKSNYGEEWYLL